MGKRGCSGRNRKLTLEQERELIRRYGLHRKNCPKALANDFGITPNSVLTYVRRASLA